MASFLNNSIIKLVKVNTLKEIRSYARWTHRRPHRILANEEYNVVDTNNHQEPIFQSEQQFKPNWIPKNLKPGLTLPEHANKTENKAQKQQKRKKDKLQIKTPVSKDTVDMLETVIDSDGNLVFTKLKDNDPSISQLLLMVKSHREQVKQNLALLEGKRLIREALEAKCQLQNLIFSRRSDLEVLIPFLPKTGAKILKMPYREIQMWSDLTTTPGIMGIFKIPDVQKFESRDFLPITLICDNIREPGNLGAVLRTAAAVGVENVFLTKGCVGLWDTKVLRSACGAHFHVQIHKTMDWPDIEQHVNKLASVVFIADNKIISESVKNKVLDTDVEEKNLTDIVLSMPLLPYYGVQFSNYKSLVLIVGGETQGISEESFRLANSFGGVRLNIPMNDCVESLNVGTALGVILFEMKKQLMLSVNENLKLVSLK